MATSRPSSTPSPASLHLRHHPATTIRFFARKTAHASATADVRPWAASTSLPTTTAKDTTVHDPKNNHVPSPRPSPIHRQARNLHHLHPRQTLLYPRIPRDPLHRPQHPRRRPPHHIRTHHRDEAVSCADRLGLRWSRRKRRSRKQRREAQGSVV